VKVKFTVLGEPQGKERARAVALFNKKTRQPVVDPKTGRAIISEYTPDKTVQYENLIKSEYRRQIGIFKFQDNAMLDMRVMAYYTIPKSDSKVMQRKKETGEIRPTKKPDWDNIAKVVADSLNKVAYKDDAQVVDAQVRKFYSRQPRIEVTILTANK